MLYVKDCLEVFADASPEARVVLQLDNGAEIDLRSAQSYTTLLVLVPEVPVEDGSQAEALKAALAELEEKLEDL